MAAYLFIIFGFVLGVWFMTFIGYEPQCKKCKRIKDLTCDHSLWR